VIGTFCAVSLDWIAHVLEDGWIGGVKLKGRRALDITTYRCTSCGYLESYATPKVAPVKYYSLKSSDR
jgi:hypothetical protein